MFELLGGVRSGSEHAECGSIPAGRRPDRAAHRVPVAPGRRAVRAELHILAGGSDLKAAWARQPDQALRPQRVNNALKVALRGQPIPAHDPRPAAHRVDAAARKWLAVGVVEKALNHTIGGVRGP
ncbi:MAG: hypothetical protein U1E72_03690 [Burkholderiaceae bacterium]